MKTFEFELGQLVTHRGMLVPECDPAGPLRMVVLARSHTHSPAGWTNTYSVRCAEPQEGQLALPRQEFYEIELAPYPAR